MDATIPFSFVLGHMITIPVNVNGKEDKFIFDTGIGLTLISKRIADSPKLKFDGSFVGKRMSGQEVSINLTRISSLGVGTVEAREVAVGVFDIPGLPSDIGGILSPGFLKGTIFTVNYESNELILRQKNSAIEDICDSIVPIEVVRNGSSVTIFINVDLPIGKQVKLEVDTGSSVLILNSSLMEELSISKEGPQTEVFNGTDETGNSYTRYFSKIKGRVAIAGADDVFYTNPEAIFQNIIYDGLLGNEFLKHYNVTYDLLHKKMGFSQFDSIE